MTGTVEGAGPAKEQVVWRLEYTERTSASPQRIWSWYLDHRSAPSWDPLIAEIRPDGPIAIGIGGSNKPRFGPPVRFTYTEVTEDRSYTEVSHAPGARMAFTHLLIRDGDATVVTHGLECEGPLTPLYRLLLGRSYRKGMPEALTGLLRLAQQGPPPGEQVPT